MPARRVPERRRCGAPVSLEQELAREQRAVQRPAREDARGLGHRPIIRTEAAPGSCLEAGFELGLLACLADLVDLLAEILAALLAAFRIKQVRRRGGEAHPHQKARES